MSAPVASDPRFRDLAPSSAGCRRLFTGLSWAEGPCWHDGRLLVSDIPGDRILAWSPGRGAETFRAPSGRANGNTLDREGRLVTCEHATRRVTRTEPGGAVTVLADRFGGLRFNSPNDAAVRADGTVFFTDPDYGFRSTRYAMEGAREIGFNGVFRIDPATGAVALASRDFAMPNGLAFSPDGSVLWIADSGRSHDPAGPHHVRAFRFDADDRLAETGPAIEVDPGVPDGLRVDELGNLWISAADGVHVHAPDGTPLGVVPVPEVVANLEFGGPDGRTLFVAATTSVYALDLGVRGDRRG